MTPYEKAIDQELICANIGCVCEGDDYETAQKNLSELIRWHVDFDGNHFRFLRLTKNRRLRHELAVNV